MAYICTMITIYGIPNCDTVQKAIKWLNANKIEFRFHNYREHGIDKQTLEKWLQHFAINKLVNTRSTTYKELSDADKKCIDNKEDAIAVMMQYNSVIKRPVWDLGDGRYFLGWDEKELSRLLVS